MSRDVPCLLLVDDDPLQRALTRAALEPSWHVLDAHNGRAALAILDDNRPDLILLDLQMPDMTGEETARRLRERADDTARVPILAYSATRSPDDGKPMPAHMDGVIDKSGSAASLVQSLVPWRPASLESTHRIEASLGKAAVDDMVDRLAARLQTALDEIERGLIDRDEAHRLAGLCGTLGFAEAYRAWLALSHGDDSALADVRRTARVAINGIARRA